MLNRSVRALALVGSLVIGSMAGQALAQDRVLVSAVGTNPPHFNRLLTTEVATSAISAALFETLIRLDKNYTPVPGLATAWSISADATEYRFTIREGVKFHDGKPLTVDDVQFTLATYLPVTPQISILKSYLESVTVDGGDVVVKLNAPFAPFVEAMAGLPIVPKHVYGDGQDIATHPANMTPVGTGPFRFESFQSGDRVMVVRFDDYWGEKSDVTRIVYPVLPDANARILALEAGDVHYVAGSYIDKAAYQRLLADQRFASMPSLGGISTVTVHVNARSGPLADVAVRRAIYQALNREMIAERAYYGFATPARGPIPSGLVWPISADVNYSNDLPFDPAAAAKALDEAGYPAGADGKRFSLDIAYIAEFGTQSAAASVMKSNLAEVGIELNQVGEEFSIWAQRSYKDHKFDLTMVFYTSYEDPSIGVARAYVCNPDNVFFRNASGICDAEGIDAHFAKAASVADRDERRAAFGEAEKGILNLMHTFPVVEEPALHFGRQDVWNFEAAHAVYPINWSLVKAR